MRIEEYGINVSIKFHDCRKQGYESPVEMHCMLKSFVEKVPQLPLVRGEIKIFRSDHFSVSTTIGFKSGLFLTATPRAEYLKWDSKRKFPVFQFKINSIHSPVYGAIVLANKSEYISFLNSLIEFSIAASVI
jgi:hypothetical protein